MDTIRKAFQGAETKKLDMVLASASKKVKAPKIEKKTHSKGGRHNGIPLAFEPESILSVTDEGKPTLKWQLVGQTVVAIGRNFAAPVVIEYVTVKEREIWRDAMIAAVQKELAKS
jgi:hypothetical protein